MLVALTAFALGATEQEATDTKRAPKKIDFEFAQAVHVHEVTGIGSNGIVHCNRFRGYRATKTVDPEVYAVRYTEYRSKGSWKKLSAKLRRNGDRWLWIAGDQPKCSLMVITD